MSNRDDDDLLDDPDREPTAAERAHAKSFGELVDKTLLGQPLPPAMSADDRALLEVATVIRATSGAVPLEPSNTKSIVEDALRKAIGESGRPMTSSAPELPAVIPLAARGKRRVLPWAIASISTAVAAAAVVVLLVRAPKTVNVAVPTATIPTSWTSRPTDALIGPIARDRAGDAMSRIDTIFADRLEGYRDRTLGGSR